MSKKKNPAAPVGLINPRRRLLSGGVVAGISTQILPPNWVRPVVESVSLPVHAQSSMAEASSPPIPCPVPGIPPISVSCTDTDSHVCTRHVFTLEEGCLVRTEVGCDGQLPRNAVDIIAIVALAGISIEVSTQDDLGASFIFKVSQNCYFPEGNFILLNNPYQSIIYIEGSGGYVMEFEITREGPTVSLSGISIY